MPELDNLMVMLDVEYNTNEDYWQRQNEIWAEREDRDYEDSIFKEEK